MSTLKLLVLTISTCILVSGVINQAPTPAPASAGAEMKTALDKLVTGKCWKKTDVTGITFTASRRAQAPTPPATTCPTDWAAVVTKWTANNAVFNQAKTDFDAAMVKVRACLVSGRRLQAPTPAVDNCKDGETALKAALDKIELTIGAKNLAQQYVTDANAVTIASGHTAVNPPGDDGAKSAKSANDL